jgi:hypothetical protein
MNMSTIVVSPPTEVTTGPQTPSKIWACISRLARRISTDGTDHVPGVEHHATERDDRDRAGGAEVRQTERLDPEYVQDGHEAAEYDDGVEPHRAGEEVRE